MTAENEDGLVVAEHPGGGEGMAALLQVYPQDGLAVAILTNADTPQFREIGRILLDGVAPGRFDYRDALYAVPFDSTPAAERAAPTDSAAEAESEEEWNAAWLSAARRLAGRWEGEIAGPLGGHAVTLDIKEWGDVFVDYDHQNAPSVLVTKTHRPDRITGYALGLVDPEYEWRNSPHVVLFDLTIGVDELSGAVRFQSYVDMDEGDYYSVFDLPFWMEFRRREASR
jgi:hypothetical protein